MCGGPRTGGGHPGPRWPDGDPGRRGPAREWAAGRPAGRMRSRRGAPRADGPRPGHHGPGRRHPGGGRWRRPRRRPRTAGAPPSSTCSVRVAAALGASAGATRVATDAGWTGYERQIGTTGVTIDPDLYVALGVSGAASTSADRDPPPRGERQHRPVVPDDGHGRPGPGHRCRGPPRRAGPSPRGWTATAVGPGAHGRCPTGGHRRRTTFDAVVVGAGPAGPAAALALARAGRSVVLVERGPFPGSKNVYGGRGLRPGARRGGAPVVGGGARRAVGGAPVHHDDDRRPSRCRSTSGRRPGARPPTTG